MDSKQIFQLKPLSVIRYRLDGEPGSCNPMSLPQPLVERALENFYEIERKIKGLWEPEIVRPIDIPDRPNQDYYKTFALQFTRSYFFKNLLKCLICNEILRYHIGEFDDFVDLGSGSGPFSVALAQSFELSRLELVDCSETQLQIAESVFQKLEYQTAISFNRTSIANFDAHRKHCFASYAMGEAMQNEIDIFKIVEDSDTFTLIDSPFVVRGVNDFLESRLLRTMSGYITFSIESDLKHLVEGGGGHFCFLHKASNLNAKARF